MDAPLHTEVTAWELNQNSGRILDRVRTRFRSFEIPEAGPHLHVAHTVMCQYRDSSPYRTGTREFAGGPVRWAGRKP
jgi:hypothetical protein